MRPIVMLPLLILAACTAEKDSATDRTSYELNEQKIESTAENVAGAAEEVVTDIGRAAQDAGRKIKDEVDDIDVDVDVNRNAN